MSSIFRGLCGFKFGVVLLLEEFPYMDSEPPLPSFWFWSDLLLGQLPARVNEPVLPGYLAHSWGLVCGHQGVSTHRWACMLHIWGPTSSESLYFSLGPFGAQFPPVATWRHYMGLVVERLFTGRRDWRVLLSFRVVLKRTVLASGEGWKREVISTKHPADTLDATSHNLWQAVMCSKSVLKKKVNTTGTAKYLEDTIINTTKVPLIFLCCVFDLKIWKATPYEFCYGVNTKVICS